MTARQLVHLYPRTWRERYGEEFLETAGSGPLGVQQIVDIVSGAIDARLSSGARRATIATGGAREGGLTMNVSSFVCAGHKVRYTTRDALVGSVVMVLASLAFLAIGIVARRNGFLASGESFKAVAFPVSLLLSMPFWILKGQPWKAQAVIIGGTTGLLIAIGYLSTLI
jgi:hypothetical protein